MRKLVKDVLDEQMMESLRHMDYAKKQDWRVEPIASIIKTVLENIPARIGPNSYYRVETRSRGHKKHYDGCKPDLTPNHMAWCQYSAVSLLTSPDSFQGGMFHFYDPDEAHKEDLYGNIMLYSSGAENDPQLHEATPHEGGSRTMLLMFLESK